MDIREKIEVLVKKIKADKNFAAKFQKDPIALVEELLGVDLPNDQVQAIVDAVKAKVDLDKVGSMLQGLGGLFGKK